MANRKQTKELQQTIACRIKALRKAAGLTQEQLSESVGISPQYLSRLETARRSPSLDMIVDLSVALNTTPSVLLAEPGEGKQAARVSRMTAALDAVEEEDAAFLEYQLSVLISHLRGIRRKQ